MVKGLGLEDYKQEALEGGFEVSHILDWGFALVDYMPEELEGEGVPHRMDWGLVLVDYKQEELEVPVMGFEVHHRMGWDLVLVDCRKVELGVELGVVVPHKLVQDPGRALQML